MIAHKGIDGGRAFDWGRSSGDYAKYRDIYPQEFYDNILKLGLCVEGQRVLDLGTGTGVLPRNLYRYGAKFVGADISEKQIAEARRMTAEGGLDISYIISRAEDVDFPDGSFDVVTACQCFLYFDRNIVLPKIYKLLRDEGHLCIMWMRFLPQEDEIAQASVELVLKYNPDWTGAEEERRVLRAPPWAPPLFRVENLVSFVIAVPFTQELWNGRMMSCRGIGASSLTQTEIDKFGEEHRQLMQSFPESFHILHSVTMIDLIKQ